MVGAKMNVLSLFDGMACGRIALERAGIPVENYFAAEIDKYAIQIAQKNYPEITQLGDVRNIDEKMHLPNIDLVIGGSPCQGFSRAGKGLNFEDPRSALFFEFVRILHKVSPQYFLLENVQMKQEHQDVVNEYLGVKPLKINSALVSAQNRVRLYWTNIPNIGQPEDKQIMLPDILQQTVDEKYTVKTKNIQRYLPKEIQSRFIDPYNQTNIQGDKSTALRTNSSNGNMWVVSALTERRTEEAKKERREHRKKTGKDWCSRRGKELVPRTDNKANCLTTSLTKEHILEWVVDRDKSYCIDANYFKGGNLKSYFEKHRRQLVFKQSSCLPLDPPDLIVREATKKGYTEIKDGDCFDATFPKSKTRRGRNMKNKSNCLTAATYDYMRYEYPNYRKLTPTECERLQTVPDGYTEGVSNTQRYKMLGNGWTVDIIAHILREIQ